VTSINPHTIPPWKGGLATDQRSPRAQTTNVTARPIHQQTRQVPAANRRYGAVFGETWIAADPDIVREKGGFLFLRGILCLGTLDAIVSIEIAGDTYTSSNPESSVNYRGDWSSSSTWITPYTRPYAAQPGEIYRFGGQYYVVKTPFVVSGIVGDETPTGTTYRANFGRVYADTNVNAYRGVAGQGVDPLMVELLGSSYTETLTGSWYGNPYQLAYVTAKIPVQEFDVGWPTLRVLVRGWHCFDPRTGVKTFTRNPALHLATAISSPLIGLDKKVNSASVAVAADRCAAPFPDGERIQCNLEIGGAPLPTLQWIETLRGYAGVMLDYRDGEYHFVVDGPRAIDWRILFGDASSDVEMVALPEIELVSTADRKNVVRVKYTDTSVTPWKETTVVAESAAVSSGAELPVVQEYRMPGILVTEQAERYAWERLFEHQLETWISTVPVADEGAAVHVGHVALLASPNGLNREPGRVMSKSNPAVGLWLLRCRQYDANSYQEP